MRCLIFLIVLGFSILGCKETSRTEVNFTQEEVKNKLKEVIVDPCIRCDSVFHAFPKDSVSFEKLYGYPDGERQQEAPMDIDSYFECLSSCYNYQWALLMVELEAQLKFDADGPSYVQYNTTNYLLKHDQIADQIYGELTCDSFEKHIKFSFEQISKYDSFYPKLCDFLQKRDLTQRCKQKLVEDYCIHKNVETHEY